jgi:iron complex outermembrane receptor protein
MSLKTSLFLGGLVAVGSLPAAAPVAQPSAADPAIVALSSFTVTEDKAAGYRPASSISATGIGTAIIDTPIAINVLTGDFLADTAAFEFRDVLSFAPGVRTSENNESRFRVRGFDALALLRNGHYRRQLFPTWNIDRVEVIKGAAAIFHGSNRPGGIINYLTRRPSFTPDHDLKLLVGAHDHYRGEIGLAGPLNRTVAYRVGLGQYSAGGFRDFWHNRGGYQGAGVTVRPNDRLEVTLDLERMSQHISDQQSTELFVTNDQRSLARIYPAADPTGYRYNLGGPDSFRDYASGTIDLDVRLRLGAALVYRLEGNFAEDDFRVLRTQNARANAGANAGTVTIRFGDYANYRDSWDLKNTFISRFAFAGLRHTAQLGHQVNEVRQKTPGFGRKNGRDGPNFVYNPATGAFPEFPALAPQYPLQGRQLIERIGTRTADGPWNDNRRIKEASNSVYLVDSADAFGGRLKLMAGARYNQLRRTLAWDSRPNIEPADSIVQSRVTPQFGILAKLTREWSVFASYSESLEPQNSVDADGNVAGPVEGKGWEAGLKADAFGQRLSGSVSAFGIDRTNTATRDTARELRVGRSPYFFFGNTDTVAGAEADLAFNPVASWQILATYTWLWQRETTAAQDRARIGTPFVLTPEHAASLWTKFAPVSGPLRGWEFGGGVRWDNGYLLTALIPAGPSRTYDAMLRYSFKLLNRRMSATLNLKNVTDERNFGGFLNWTNPRELYLSLHTRF